MPIPRIREPNVRIIAAAVTPRSSYAVQHALGAVREMGVEPVFEQGLDLQGRRKAL